MFTEGIRYDIELLDGVDDKGGHCITTYPGRYVQDQDGPLIKINDGANGHMIINTHSAAFFRAIKSGMQ